MVIRMQGGARARRSGTFEIFLPLSYLLAAYPKITSAMKNSRRIASAQHFVAMIGALAAPLIFTHVRD